MVKTGVKRKFKESYKGSTLGKKWVNKDGIRKNVSPNEIDTYLNNGWSLGSGNFGPHKCDKNKNWVKGYKWMHNDTLKISKQVNPSLIDDAIKDGWILGRVSY